MISRTGTPNSTLSNYIYLIGWEEDYYYGYVYVLTGSVCQEQTAGSRRGMLFEDAEKMFAGLRRAASYRSHKLSVVDYQPFWVEAVTIVASYRDDLAKKITN